MNSSEPQPLVPSHGRRLGFVRWAGIVVVFFALYGLTAQRSVNWQDSGIFQYRILTGDFEGTMGLALAHPMLIVLGKVMLFFGGRENLPLLSNFLSAFAMAIAMANLAALGTRLSQRRWIGAMIAAITGLAHTVWWLATITETYPWLLAVLTGELVLLTSLIRQPRVRTLLGLTLLAGLGLCVHDLALLPLPVYAAVAITLVVRRRLPAWSLAAAAGVYVIGAGLFLTLIVMVAIREGSLVYAIHSALVGDFGKDVANVTGISKFWKENAILSCMNFINPLLPLAIVGWVRFHRQLGGMLAAALGGITLIEIVFFVRYPVPDQFMFILPSLVMISAAAAVGLAVLVDAGRAVRWITVTLCLLSLAVQPAFYASAPQLAKRFRGEAPKRLAFRDEWRYWLTPWKQNEDSAERFCEAVYRNVESDAIVLLDSTPLPPMQVYILSHSNPQNITAMSLRHFQAARDNDPATYQEWIKRPIYIRSVPPEEQTQNLFGAATFTPCFDDLLFRVEPQP